MERLIELFINTEDGEFYDRGGLLAAYDPAINAGELVRLTVQLCAGVPAFNSAGALLNPDTTFAGTLAAAETIIDNNFNWYDKGTLLENLTTGTAISELSVASEAAPRQLGAVRLNADTVVNFCGWTATEGGYRLTLADNEFKPAQFTPAADFAQGAALEVLEQPIIVSAQNDDSGRATGLFTGLLDAANPVYESMIEGHEDIPNCRIEFSIYQDGRAVFRARRYFDCLGAMAMNKGAAYVHSDSWREADSRYIKLVDWQAPPEYQFSEDGTNWHDQQQDADLYYHERRPGGQWGPAVKMKTGPTGAAAGFGTPSVTVETLPAGSDATASVTASGDNTAKVFSFSLGIPKGADGQNGTNGADGAAGADGVSSYTYVAYASDASGAGFSLTPTNALKYRAEIHTATAIETPDAEDFAGATWVKYLGDDGTGAGDMTKSVYDTNDDGIVDHAATADAVGATTAAQVADAVGKAHAHANKTTLDKLAETDGKLTFDGAEIGGGSGTVKSVNGQLPDESGNVTIETGGAVDESRLLPETGSVSSDSVGNPVIFKAISRIDNTYWLCLPLNEDTNDRSTYDVATEVYGTVNIVSNAPSSPGGSAFFNGSSCLHGTLPAQFGASDFTVRFWMMAPTISSSSQTIFSTRYGDQTDASTFALLCTTEGRLFIYSNGDITSRTDTPFTLQPSVWYHVAVVRKSGVLTIYVNGEVYNSATFTNSLTRQIFGLGASWTGSSYSEAGTVYLTSLDVLNYAAYDGAFTTPAYQPGILAGAGYEVATDSEFKDMLSAAGIDESRLLPALDSVPVDRSGNPVVFKAISAGMDKHTLLYCPFDADMNDHSNAGGQFVQTGQKSESIVTTEKKFGSGCLNCGSGYSFLNGPLAKPVGDVDCTIHFWANITSFTGKSPFTLLTAAIPDDSNATSNFGQAAIGCLQLYVSNGLLLLERRTSSNGHTVRIIEASVSLTTGAWNHFAITRSGNIWYLFLNGQLLGTGSDTNVASATHIRIGGDSSAMSGYVDEFLVLDYAKWITDFEPPTQPATTLTKSYEVSDKGFGTVKSVNGQTPDSSGVVTLPAATASAAGLMAAADKVKLDALQQAATYINTATDFDTYKTAGSYFLKGAVHTNGPLTDSYAGTLVVVALAELQYATQYFTQLYTNKTFVRTYAQDNSAWSAWRRIIVDTDLATTTVAGLMSATDKAAIAGLTAQGIYPNVAVAAAGSGIDYNLFKTQGTFYIPYHTAVSNGPGSAGSNGVYPGGFLSILQANLSGGTSVQQIFHQHASNNAYIRSYNGDLDIWTDWQRTVTDTDITELKARPGYFKLPGGTIVQWGATTDLSADGTTEITLPLAFPNEAFVAISTATVSGITASAIFSGTTKLNVIAKGYTSTPFKIYWVAIGR